jgi:hypothetical protein
MWIALMSAMIMPILAGILLLKVPLNSGARDDADPPHAGL